jgi:hypothetical protein
MGKRCKWTVEVLASQGFFPFASIDIPIEIEVCLEGGIPAQVNYCSTPVVPRSDKESPDATAACCTVWEQFRGQIIA